MDPVLILGATSGLGGPLAEEYARCGHDLHLTARQPAALEELAERLRREFGVAVWVHPFDVRNTRSHEAFFRGLEPAPIGMICLIGSLGAGPTPPSDIEDLTDVLEVNFVGCAAILEVAAGTFERAGRGFIVGVSSVAGDRGRMSNYPYGSAKAGLTAFLSGLRQRLHRSGVTVLTVKPGYLRTRMTEGMDLPALLTAEPAEAARAIHRAQSSGASVLYVRGVWRAILLVLRVLPEAVFKRLRL